MKNIYTTIFFILLSVSSLLLCKIQKPNSKLINPFEEGYLVLIENIPQGPFDYEMDIVGWQPGKEYISIPGYQHKGTFFYLWQGEDTVTYRFDEGLLYVNDKLIGADLTAVVEIPDPAAITTIYTDVEHIPESSIFPNLVALSLGKATDEDLANLAEFTNLRILYLNGVGITDKGLQHITTLKNLRELIISNNPITDAGLIHLKDLTNLKSLSLSNTRITDVGLQRIKVCEGLSDLGLKNCKGITDAGIQHLKDLNSLTRLNLGGTPITDAGLAHLAGLQNLAVLNISETEITGSGLAYLSGNDDLKILNLSKTQFDDSYVKDLECFKKLRSLDIRWTEVTSEGFVELGKLGNLRLLRAGSPSRPVTDEGLRYIGGLKNLVVLGVIGDMDDNGLRYLAKLQNLRRVELGSPNISDDGIKPFKNMKNLKDLSFMNTRITDKGLRELREALPAARIRR